MIRDAGQPHLSMYAIKKAGLEPTPMWPPREGFYEKAFMVPGPKGPKAKRFIPIRIWLSPARDPHTGEEMDRSPTWLCDVDGKSGRLEYVWPECSGRPITERAYEALLRERDADDGFNPEIDPWEI